MSKYQKQEIYESKCGDLTIRGSASQLVKKYEELAVNALKEQRDLAAQQYSQHAEHYRKVEMGEV